MSRSSNEYVEAVDETLRESAGSGGWLTVVVEVVRGVGGSKCGESVAAAAAADADDGLDNGANVVFGCRC